MRFSRIRVAVAGLAVLTLAACAQQEQKPPPAAPGVGKERLRSVLVVPVVNRSAEVNAPDGLLVTLPVPVAERGYYIFPAHMVRRTMEDDGLGDADLVHRADPVKLAGIFGADAVLFAVIEEWNSQYVVLATTTTVAIRYTLKSGKTGETLWTSVQRRQFTAGPQGEGVGGLIAGAVAAAIERASPTYMPLARQASRQALTVGRDGVPYGPYYRPVR